MSNPLTGIDAMVHAIEAYTSARLKNPMSDMFARKALRLISENLLIVCDRPDGERNCQPPVDVAERDDLDVGRDLQQPGARALLEVHVHVCHRVATHHHRDIGGVVERPRVRERAVSPLGEQGDERRAAQHAGHRVPVATTD